MWKCRVPTSRRNVWRCLLLGVAAFCLPNQLAAHPSWAPLGFEPPPPGTYALPTVQAAADGEVLDTAGNRRRLFDFMHDKVVVLSFIYIRCADGRGCPLATGALLAVEEALQHEPALGKHVRLLSLSFDPGYDTPEVMQRYAQPGHGPSEHWQPLTTASWQSLQPILEGYGQYVAPILDARGEFTGTYSHLLKVFLIDRHQHVRNIYSVDFLHPDLLINDIKTLLLGEGTLALSSTVTSDR